MHDVNLSRRLQLAEDDFLIALGNDADLFSCHQAWSTLPDLLLSANGNPGDDRSILYVAASRTSSIASCLLNVKREEDYATTQLRRDCDAVFDQMAGLSLREQPKSSLQNDISPSSPPTRANNPVLSTQHSHTQFLTPAHQWLQDNLHNPYPSAEVKARIAAASFCQVSSVNSWFINARRRIGWTTLCRKRFSNCRADMVEAAYRALVEEDPRRPLPPDLRHSFVAIKVAVDGLLPSTFTRSAFVGDLDAIVNDMAQGHKESVEVAKSCRSEQAGHQIARNSYPSPDRSVASSPVPTLDYSLTDESEGDDIIPPVIAGSKRRRSSIEPDGQQFTVRPIKRLRASKLSTHLPSPPSSTNDTDISSDDGSPRPSPAPFIRPGGNLFGADSAEIPKCLNDSMTVPPIHTISNLLTLFDTENKSSIDDWFRANFDASFVLPPPVEATQPDASAPWEVELFQNYNIPGNPECELRFLPSSTATHTLSGPYDLLPCIEGDTFVTPSESIPTSGTAVDYTATGLDSLIPGISQGDIDWTSLLDDSVTFQPDIDFTLPQYPTRTQPLPEIDLSMLQLPHVTPPIDSQSEFASKQAKLDQLHAMQDAVRRMELELQSEGIIS